LLVIPTRVRGALGKLRANLPARRPPHDMAVCAIFRNEATYLAEWVEFHERQGVERFWLYDNRSTDDWRSAVDPWQRSGLVTVTPWPAEPGQYSAYADCLKGHRNDAKWIAFLDLDEFLFSPRGRPLPEVLRNFEGASAVVAAWRVYGSNGHKTPPTGRVIENYRRRFPDDHPANNQVKSIVDPRKTSPQVENPHFFRHYGQPITENGTPYIYRDPFTDLDCERLSAQILRVNHYVTKSEVELQAKLERRRADTGEIYREASTHVLDLPASETVEDSSALDSLAALSAAVRPSAPA
jgi:hypothetical protein